MVNFTNFNHEIGGDVEAGNGGWTADVLTKWRRYRLIQLVVSPITYLQKVSGCRVFPAQFEEKTSVISVGAKKNTL